MTPEPQLRDPVPFEEPPEARQTPTPPKRGIVARISSVLVPAIICLAGAGVAGVLVASRPVAQRTEPEHHGVPVEVAALQPTREPIRVRANGTVIAAARVVLQPELSGRVTWVSPELVPGGRIRAGEPLLRIDARDYQAALAQSQAQLESSRLGLQTEASRQAIASRECELLRL